MLLLFGWVFGSLSGSASVITGDPLVVGTLSLESVRFSSLGVLSSDDILLPLNLSGEGSLGVGVAILIAHSAALSIVVWATVWIAISSSAAIAAAATTVTARIAGVVVREVLAVFVLGVLRLVLLLHDSADLGLGGTDR